MLHQKFYGLVLPISIIVLIGFGAYSDVYAQVTVSDGGTYIENQAIENQVVGEPEKEQNILDLLIGEGIATLSGILIIGVGAIVAWMRKHGIAVTTEQEKMFKDIVSKRFEKLAKETWQDMRANPNKFNGYWKNYLSKGKIPKEFVDRLHNEGSIFANELKKNKEFQDFAKNLTENSTEKLLANLRTKLKSDYQKRMVDLLPKLVSIAVDSAFDENVTNHEQWVKSSLENLKPLLLSTEAIDTQENLMIIINSEINKRIQSRLIQK